ncbi:hypothetical protein [Massilia sp. WG5]|uniref:hypothetical protein n=1 Tax=Massilia sp. WG5 TaxID=1707785 RepID=UPI0013A56E21|nr:hypothetical protein [Massilia sp. WG5]
MRKNEAGPRTVFLNATNQVLAGHTCPQFLWINLCEIPFPQGKPLILIREIFPMKILAAMRVVSTASAQFASAHFLWTKLCASACGKVKAFDS